MFTLKRAIPILVLALIASGAGLWISGRFASGALSSVTSVVTIDETFPSSLLPFPSDDECPTTVPCKALVDVDITDVGAPIPQITIIIPSELTVASGSTVTNGNTVGSIQFSVTTIFGDLINCDEAILATGTFLDGALKGEGADDNTAAALIDADVWPTRLESDARVSELLTSQTMIRRSVTEADNPALSFPVNILFFDVSDGDGFAGLTDVGTYGVVVAGDPTAPLGSVVCTPLSSDVLALGETSANELLQRCDSVGTNTFKTVFSREDGFGNIITPFDAEVTDDTSCFAFTPTPTPTITLTPTATPTQTLTPTPKATPTPKDVPTPNLSAEGSLSIDANCENPATDTVVENSRIALVGEIIHICVSASFPAASASGYQTRLHWSEAVFDLNARTSSVNDVWGDQIPANGGPPNGVATSQTLGPADDKSGSEAYVQLQALDASNQNASPPYQGRAAQFELVCQSHAWGNIELRDPGSNTVFYDGVSTVKPSLLGAVIGCLEPTFDSDLDGCTNDREVDTNEGAGGQRNPLDFWDYGDMPDPNATPQRDRLIRIPDIVRVVERFGMDENETIDRFTNPLSTPPKTGYHPAYDRGGQTGANTWNQAPANGTIRIPDIVNVVQQFGHDCA